MAHSQTGDEILRSAQDDRLLADREYVGNRELQSGAGAKRWRTVKQGTRSFAPLRMTGFWQTQSTWATVSFSPEPERSVGAQSDKAFAGHRGPKQRVPL